MKILIADDDRDLLGLIAFTLTQAGYLVVKASDGRRRFTRSKANRRIFAVLDINMPGASGFQVCEAIRSQSRIPIMMLTVRGEEEDLIKALELGRTITSRSPSARAPCSLVSRRCSVVLASKAQRLFPRVD